MRLHSKVSGSEKCIVLGVIKPTDPFGPFALFWRCSLEDASKSLSVEEWLVEVLLVSERTLKATSQDDVFIGANTALCSLPMLSIVWRCACEYNLDYQGLKRQSGKGQTSGISPAYIDDKMLH